MLAKKNIPGFIALGLTFVGFLVFPLYVSIGAVILGIIGIVLVRNDIAGVIAMLTSTEVIIGEVGKLVDGFALIIHPVEYMILLCIIGYGFAIANEGIGISSIKDLNILKAQLGMSRMHKLYGRAETTIFLSVSIQCVMGPVVLLLTAGNFNPSVIEHPVFLAYPTVFWHTFIGGILPFGLFLIKIVPAFANKDFIYKYGMILGPIGFVAWSLAYFTSLADYYLLVINPLSPVMVMNPTLVKEPFIWPDFGWALATSVVIGVVGYLYARVFDARSSNLISPSTHGVALVLHGISFGYENAAKELVGAPVLYKYVYPYTYKSLDKLAYFLGIDLDELKSMNVNDALEYYMQKCASIGMAERIKVKWTSESSFSVESVNCSTAAVRSKIPKEEIKGSICPWALLAASLVNKLTGKDMEIAPSEFYEIGAKTEITIREPQ
ncbi:MAG: hypothetical protein JW839_19505 [Candidatus Lokiarchaeota archaeon]|nr:hypothetical protein [Candidatus Lokiarchaeota archaeon]